MKICENYKIMNKNIKFEKNIAAYSILQRNAVIDRKSITIYIYIYIVRGNNLI